jgi:hypothetical protein
MNKTWIRTALAGEADVVDVKVRAAAPRVCDFDVTVRSCSTRTNPSSRSRAICMACAFRPASRK